MSMVLIITLLFSSLANDLIIRFEAPKESRLKKKETHVQLLINCVYTLVLAWSPTVNPRAIPSGDVFIIFKNFSPLHELRELESCSKHKNETNGIPQIFQLMGSACAKLFKFENKHWGIQWTIPEGNTLPRLELPIKFICSSEDAEYANKHTRWQFEVFYRNEISLSTTILCPDNSFKVSTKITPQRLKITKIRSSHEPLKKIESKKDDTVEWDFDGDSPTLPLINSISTTTISVNVREELKWITEQVTQLTSSIARLAEKI